MLMSPPVIWQDGKQNAFEKVEIKESAIRFLSSPIEPDPLFFHWWGWQLSWLLKYDCDELWVTLPPSCLSVPAPLRWGRLLLLFSHTLKEYRQLYAPRRRLLSHSNQSHLQWVSYKPTHSKTFYLETVLDPRQRSQSSPSCPHVTCQLQAPVYSLCFRPISCKSQFLSSPLFTSVHLLENSQTQDIPGVRGMAKGHGFCVPLLRLSSYRNFHVFSCMEVLWMNSIWICGSFLCKYDRLSHWPFGDQSNLQPFFLPDVGGGAESPNIRIIWCSKGQHPLWSCLEIPDYQFSH